MDALLCVLEDLSDVGQILFFYYLPFTPRLFFSLPV